MSSRTLKRAVRRSRKKSRRSKQKREEHELSEWLIGDDKARKIKHLLSETELKKQHGINYCIVDPPTSGWPRFLKAPHFHWDSAANVRIRVLANGVVKVGNGFRAKPIQLWNVLPGDDVIVARSPVRLAMPVWELRHKRRISKISFLLPTVWRLAATAKGRRPTRAQVLDVALAMFAGQARPNRTRYMVIAF